jgi:hypothetical protein
MILTLECGYYGSAAALGALVIAATHIRSVKGVLGGMLAAVAVGGLAYGSYTVIAPTLSKLSSGEIQAGGSFRVIMGRAELWALIPGIDPPPPPPGMPDPFVSAPPIMIWVLFFVAGIYSFRKSYWTSIMALFFLGVATQSPVLSWWSDGPLGSFIQNLRRFAAPMTLMMLCTIGYGWEHWKQSSRYIHKPRVFGVVLLVLLIWSAQDLLLRYPLLWTPKVPLIAQTITQDTNPGSVLVYPQEQEGRRATTHQYLRKDTSFSNPQARLWFQTLINRPMHHYTKLATLIPKSGRRWKLDGGTLSRIELEQMRTKGLRYVVVDNTQLSTQAQQQTKGLFTQLGYGCSDFDEWGGLTLCLLAQR